jgi:RND family efflux transporter MFP subunit
MRPPRTTVALAWILAIGIAAATAVLFYAPWVQTAVGNGQVAALNPSDRAQEVSALVPGRVERWYVQDGQLVAQGAPIARVVDVDPNYLTSLAAERGQIEAEIEAARQAQAVASIDVGRSRQLLAEGLAARRDLEQAQIKVADSAAKLAEARAKLNRINVQLSRQSAQLVRAPRDGRIQKINAAAGGALVSAGTVLAVIAPERVSRAVELFVDGRDVALVRPGQRVRLEFEGWPAIQFSGWPSIARGLFDGRVRTIDPNADTNGLFRVLIEPMPGAAAWPDRRFIRLGAKVRGWIQMETVSVGFELWRQLNDFPLEFSPADRAGTAAPKDADADVLNAGKPK